MDDFRSSLQIMHEERERLRKENLSSRQELHFGFHVLRESRLSGDDMYETDLLSRESNSLQSLANFRDGDRYLVFDSIEQFIPDSVPHAPPKGSHGRETPQARRLSFIQELDGESESVISRPPAADDVRPKNSMERSTRTPKVEMEEHLQNLSRDYIKKERNSNCVYNHYGPSNFATKSLVSEIEHRSSQIEPGFRVSNSESAPHFGTPAKDDFSFPHQTSPHKSMNKRRPENTRDSFGLAWKTEHQGLFSQALEKMASGDVPSLQMSLQKPGQVTDSFENLKIFDNSEPGKKVVSLQTSMDEKQAKREGVFRKQKQPESPAMEVFNLGANKTSINIEAVDSAQKRRSDGLVIVNTESLDYSNKDCGRLGLLEAVFESRQRFKKGLMEERIDSEGTCNDTDRQQKSASSNAMIHKSSVKNVNLRDSESTSLFVKPDSFGERPQPLLSVTGTHLPESRQQNLANTSNDSHNLLSERDRSSHLTEVKRKESARLTIISSPPQAVHNQAGSPSVLRTVKSVKAKVTDLAMPGSSGNSYKNGSSRSPASKSGCFAQDSGQSKKNASPKTTEVNITPIDFSSGRKALTSGRQSANKSQSRVVPVYPPWQKADLTDSQVSRKFTIASASPNSQKKSSFSSFTPAIPTQTTFKKPSTPLKTIQGPPKPISKSPSATRFNQMNFGVLLQKYPKRGLLQQNTGTDLFRNHFSQRAGFPGEFSTQAPRKTSWMVNSHLQENKSPFDKGGKLNASAASGSRKSCTPTKSKHSMVISAGPLQTMTVLADRLVKEIQRSVHKKDSASCASSASTFGTTVSCRKAIRILKDLRFVDPIGLNEEDCQLIEVLATALDPTESGRVNVRELTLFVLAIYGIQMNELMLEDLPEASGGFGEGSRYSVSSVKATPSVSKSTHRTQGIFNWHLEMKRVVSQGNGKASTGRNTSNLFDRPNENQFFQNQGDVRHYLGFLEEAEVQKICATFTKFRENREKVNESFAKSSKNSVASSQKSSYKSLFAAEAGPVQTVPIFPDAVFRKQKASPGKTFEDCTSVNVGRPSTKTNPESVHSHKSTYKRDTGSDRGVWAAFSRSRSPLTISNTSPAVSQSKLKKNYSVVSIGGNKFLPFMRDNNQEGNILKLEIVIGPDQVEEVYICREDPEPIASKVSKLQRKCHLDERQTEAMVEIIQREVNELQWPCA